MHFDLLHTMLSRLLPQEDHPQTQLRQATKFQARWPLFVSLPQPRISEHSEFKMHSARYFNAKHTGFKETRHRRFILVE
jgi:hypothetical protein